MKKIFLILLVLGIAIAWIKFLKPGGDRRNNPNAA